MEFLLANTIILILKNSFLVSSLLCNSESWYNLTKAEDNLIESIDLQLLRSIFNVPKSTPKEMFYMEMGCLPLRYLIKKRRILFLHYILNENQKSMIYRFLMTQIKTSKKKDWIIQVMVDLKELNLGEDLEQIRKIKRLKFKDILDKRIKEQAFQDLENMKETHSKVMNIKHRGKKYW